MKLTMDLSGLQPAVAQSVMRHLQHEDRARHALGLIEQLKLKRFYDAHPAFGHGLGGEVRQSAVITADQTQRVRDKYGDLCFADPDFMPWLLKQPEGADFVVKDVATRIQSGWTPKTL